MIAEADRHEIQTTLGIRLGLASLLLVGGAVTLLLVLGLVWALFSVVA